MSSALDPSLATSVCGIALRNPVLAASGTFGYGLEFEKLVDLNSLGGLVVKGLSREPIEGNPPPRVYETAAGMINSIGLQNIGVRAFVCEKLPALALDAHTRRSRIGAGLGGLSGPAIKPIALRLVWQASRAVKIPVIGLGGIATGADAAEFLIAGASAVQAGTATFWEPRSPVRIAEELAKFLKREKIGNVSRLVGTLEL